METNLEMERDSSHDNPTDWLTYITNLFSNSSYGEYSSFEEWHKGKAHELQQRITEDYEEFGDYDEYSVEIEDMWVEECAHELEQILGLEVLDVGSERASYIINDTYILKVEFLQNLGQNGTEYGMPEEVKPLFATIVYHDDNIQVQERLNTRIRELGYDVRSDVTNLYKQLQDLGYSVTEAGMTNMGVTSDGKLKFYDLGTLYKVFPTTIKSFS